MSEAEDALNVGLLAGYASDKKPREITRGSIMGKRITYVDPSISYIDEWFAGDRLGAGQDIANDGFKTAIRSYAGGLYPPEVLERVDTTPDEVHARLKQFISGSEGKTRLRQPYSITDGEWSYEYSIVEALEEVGTFVSLEKVLCRSQEVFAHYFLIVGVE